jgi:predicted TIM-barrel fold metal-dependent hydrolase
MDRLIIVSGDDHMAAQPDVMREYIDPAFRDDLDEHAEETEQFLGFTTLSRQLDPAVLDVVDDQDAIRTNGEDGAFDFDRHVQEMDREGVALNVILQGTQLTFPPFFSVVSKPHRAERRAAGVKAHHRWLADGIARHPDRLMGVAEAGPCYDMDATVGELAWCAERGFRAAYIPGGPADAELPPIWDTHFDPYWQFCQDHGWPLICHAGWGAPQGVFWQFAEQFTKNTIGRDPAQTKALMMEALASSDDSPLKLDMGPRRLLWQLMVGGVFDRFPNLNFVLVEVRADWIPATIAALDARHAQGDTPLEMKPSEYWARNGFVTPSSIHRCEIEQRYDLGVDKMLFGTDYPHPESTWPNTLDWIRATFGGVPEDEARKILGENAIGLYHLDRAKLAATAERIGPRATDVLGDQTVDPRYLPHFDARAGLSRDVEKIDVATINELLTEDLQSVAAR